MSNATRITYPVGRSMTADELADAVHIRIAQAGDTTDHPDLPPDVVARLRRMIGPFALSTSTGRTAPADDRRQLTP